MDRLLGMRAGNYEIASWIGGGGMGDVYRGVHVSIGAKVAIKVLRATTEAAPEATERFMREARAVNRIAHDGVVKITDGGRLANGQPYLVMELLEGMTLGERLAQAGTLSVAEAGALCVRVLDAVAAAHACDVVHRDLKPANIFLTRSGRVVVLDFGIARLMETNSPARLTLTGVSLGTPAYMAPELILGNAAAPEADVYAMGVVLYELLAGERLFAGAATFEVMNQHLEQPVQLSAQARQRIPPAVQAVIVKALAKRPEERYPDGATMRDALQAALAQDAKRPRRTVMLAGVIAGVVAIAGGAVALVASRHRETAATQGSAAPDPRASTAAPPVAPMPSRSADPWVGSVPPAATAAVVPPAGPASGSACREREGVSCTDRGPIASRLDGDVRVVRGVPFARPPVGPLRWKPPLPPEPWTTVREAEPPRRCAQMSPAGAPTGSEDCLYLDVYAPKDAAGRPVVFFIHGGHNIVGGRDEIDGASLARRANVVVVVASYRLNVFGWLADGIVGTGNYGLLDQLAALRWVRANIKNLGGDPARVTLLGQSAGSVDACDLLATPSAEGLFSRAVLMSGTCFTMTAAFAERVGAQALGAAGCTGQLDVAACMRAAPIEALLKAPGAASPALSTGAMFYPVVDRTVLPVEPWAALEANRHPVVPVIVGTTADELSNTIEQFVPETVPDAKAYRELVGTLYSSGAAAVLGEYPASKYPTPKLALAAALGDQLLQCPARRLARTLAAHQPDTFRYVYSYRFEAPVRLAWMGAAHGYDLLMLFGDFHLKGEDPSSDELRVRDEFTTAIARFVEGGDPGWKRSVTIADIYNVVPWAPQDRGGFHSSACAKWDGSAGQK